MEMGRRLFFYRSHFHTLMVAFGQLQYLSMSVIAGLPVNCLFASDAATRS